MSWWCCHVLFSWWSQNLHNTTNITHVKAKTALYEKAVLNPRWFKPWCFCLLCFFPCNSASCSLVFKSRYLTRSMKSTGVINNIIIGYTSKGRATINNVIDCSCAVPGSSLGHIIWDTVDHFYSRHLNLS